MMDTTHNPTQARLRKKSAPVGRKWIQRAVIYFATFRYYLQHQPNKNALPHAVQEALGRVCASWNGCKRLLDHNRLRLLLTAAQQIEKEGIPGAVVELGVHQGRTAALLRALFPQRPLLLFDTFQGFVDEDICEDPMLNEGVSPETLAGLFQGNRLESIQELIGDQGDTHYHVGHFPESTQGVDLSRPLCLIHLDCDLYKPTLAALNQLFPLLAPGGFLIVHDYGNDHWKGVRMAVDQFFSSRPERPLIWPDSGGSACLRRHVDYS